MGKRILIASAALAVLSLAVPAIAGPPFICHPFEIGAATSLPWGDTNNFMGMRDDYDFSHVVADTEKLLTQSTPMLVRMETLRRASVYASRDRAVAQQLLASLKHRAAAGDEAGHPDPLALFDAGYVAEAISELQQAGPFMKTFAGLDNVLVGLTRPAEGRALLERSAALRPHDQSIRYALTLLSPATE